VRRALAILISAALFSAAIAVSADARPGGVYVETASSEGVICRTTTTDGLLQVQARVIRDSNGANFFQLQAFKTTGPGNLAFEAYGFPAYWSDGHVQGSGELLDSRGNPLDGEASLEASFSIAGPPTTRVVRMQEGNQRTKATITQTDYVVHDPAIEITGRTLNALDCIGNFIETTTEWTTPATFVTNSRFLETVDSSSCYLPGKAEVAAEVKGRLLSVIVSNLKSPFSLAAGTIRLHGDSGTGPLDMYDLAGNVVESGSAVASIEQTGESVTQISREDETVVVRTTTPYALDAHIQLPYVTASATCDMELVVSRFRVRLNELE